MSTNTCGLREALLSLRDRSPLDCPCFDPCLMDCWLSFFHALQWTAAEVSTKFFPCIPGDVCPPFLSHKRMLCPVSLHVRFPLYLSFFPFLPWLSTATVAVRYSGSTELPHGTFCVKGPQSNHYNYYDYNSYNHNNNYTTLRYITLHTLITLQHTTATTTNTTTTTLHYTTRR